jgi:hypothetical protein
MIYAVIDEHDSNKKHENVMAGYATQMALSAYIVEYSTVWIDADLGGGGARRAILWTHSGNYSSFRFSISVCLVQDRIYNDWMIAFESIF